MKLLQLSTMAVRFVICGASGIYFVFVTELLPCLIVIRFELNYYFL